MTFCSCEVHKVALLLMQRSISTPLNSVLSLFYFPLSPRVARGKTKALISFCFEGETVVSGSL